MYQQDVRAGQESADDGTEDIVDRANNSYNRELMFSLSDTERQLMLEVDKALARIDEGAYRALRLRGEPPMTRFVAAQLARSHWYDIGAAKRDLHYTPAISTADGMQRLAAWLRQRELV